MKKVNIAKFLGIVGVCGFILGVLICVGSEFEEDFGGILLGLSIPFMFCLLLSQVNASPRTEEFHEENEDAKEDHPPKDKLPSPDPTLDNK